MGAMVSLTADEHPEGVRWPCVSPAVQSRLLLLHRPLHMQGHAGGGPEYGTLATQLCTNLGIRAPPEKLVELLKVWKCNGFITPCGRMIMVAVSHANHSCAPNCSVTFSLGHICVATIRASRDLGKGEEVTIS